MDLPTAHALGAAVDRAAHSDVRAVVVLGEGRRFCAGGDMTAMAAAPDPAAYHGRDRRPPGESRDPAAAPIRPPSPTARPATARHEKDPLPVRVDMPLDGPEHQLMVHAVEERPDAEIDHPVAPPTTPPALLHRVQHRPPRPIAVEVRMENWLHPALQIRRGHRLSLPVSLTGPAPWQCWHVPTLSGLLPPSPAFPGSGCPQLHPAAAARSRRSFTPARLQAPRGARGPRPSHPDQQQQTLPSHVLHTVVQPAEDTARGLMDSVLTP
ncbi:hypothetical protein [Streptomyces umbrinus]|uniref:hypothetical protein n=1 Tax=Streptomyces umbrinus TaxID=67370 RepID=UPI003570E18A